MKRMIGLLLCFSITIGLLPVFGISAVSPESDFAFEPSTGTISLYSGPGGDVVIPAKIGGIAVTAIGESAFAFNAGITSITIPEGVTTIGIQAFAACAGLISINIPESVTVIGNSAFTSCPSFTTIYGIPGSYAETYADANGYVFIAVKVTPIITTPPAAAAITYGQTLAASILTGGTASVDGSFAWTDGSIAPAVSDSGTTLYSITFTPADTDNYEHAAAEISVIVEKALPNIILDDYDTVYTGNIIKIRDAEVMLANNEIYSGQITYTYYTDKDCVKLTRKIHGAAAAGGAPRNIGIYFVKASVGETDNYSAASSDPAKLTICLFKPVTYYTITVTAGPGGSVSPSGGSVRQNSSKIFFIIPDKGYETADVSVDGVSAGRVWYYIFINVTASHAIYAEFKPAT